MSTLANNCIIEREYPDTFSVQRRAPWNGCICVHTGCIGVCASAATGPILHIHADIRVEPQLPDQQCVADGPCQHPGLLPALRANGALSRHGG